MKIKNISGQTQTIQVGNKALQTIANNATATFDDDPQSVADAQSLSRKGIIQILDGPGASALAASVDVPLSRTLKITGAITDGQTVTINGEVFEADDDDSVTEGNTLVDMGAGVTDFLDNLAVAITANAVLSADDLQIVPRGVVTVTADTNEFLVVSSISGTAITASETLANGSWAASVAAIEVPTYDRSVRIVTAGGTTLTVNTGLSSVVDATVRVKSSTGVFVPYDGKMIIGGGIVYLDASGDNDIANGSIVLVEALGVA